MKVLVVFDQNVDIQKLKGKIAGLKPAHISLFPLTSQCRLVSDIKRACRGIGVNGVEIIESAGLIDEEVDVIAQKISGWSAGFGNYEISGKSIKEWFSLPGRQVSTWWFSLLSEKNPLKTDIFFNIAQIAAVDKVIAQHTFNVCVLSTHNKSFLRALEALCKRHSIGTVRASGRRQNLTLRECVRIYLEKDRVSHSALKTLIGLRVDISRAVAAKKAMESAKGKDAKNNNSVLFISYFPLVDVELSEQGKLKNRYAAPLQTKLSQMGKEIIWIWIYAPLDGHDFNSALKLAAKFKRDGEKSVFLNEFVSLKLMIKVLFLWLRQIGTFKMLRRAIPDHVLYEGLSVPESAILIRRLMMDSFVGRTGLEGILSFELYKEVFTRFSYASHCVYCLEMYAWEKALNAAKQLTSPLTKSIGFQHSNCSRNLFNYFYQPIELNESGGPEFLPLPDVLACNGDIPMDLMSSCGYPNIRKVEAIRHLHIKYYLNESALSKKEKAVLIAGSIDKQETKSLISWFYEAFPEPKGFKVWLKGHPYLPLDRIVGELNIPLSDSGYIVKQGPISDLIDTARVIIAGHSSVAVDALASNTAVILPVFADCMFMSPLKGFEEYYLKVKHFTELRSEVEKLMKDSKRENFKDAKSFVNKYWCLDDSLQRWEEVLN